MQKDIHDRRNVVYASDLFGGERLADDGGVTDGIDLLQQVRQDDRERKAQNGLPARALGQVDRLEQRGKPTRGCRVFHKTASFIAS